MSSKPTAMSKTDMVRCRSIVERTRVEVVEVMNKEPEPDPEEDSEDDFMKDAIDTEVEAKNGWDADFEDIGWEMDVARVYQNTLEALGDALGDASFENNDSERP